MMTRFFGEERSLKPAIEVIPLTLFAWASFVIPYLLTAYFLGPTFRDCWVRWSVYSSSARRCVRATSSRKRWDFGPQEQWPDHWIGKIEPGTGMGTSDTGQKVAADGGTSRFEEMHSQDMSLGMAWAPYILVAALLIVTRVIGPVQGFLSSTGVITWNNILGTPFSEGIEIFYLPGSLFVLVAVVTYGLHGMDSEGIRDSWAEAITNIIPAVIALWFAGDGDGQSKRRCRHRDQQRRSRRSGHAAVAVPIHGEPSLASCSRSSRPSSARSARSSPVRTRSATSCSASFSSRRPSRSAPRPKLWSPHAQAVGGAIGNLIAIHNVVAALTVVGLIGEEGRVIRLELIPVLYYGVATGLLTLILAYVVVVRGPSEGTTTVFFATAFLRPPTRPRSRAIRAPNRTIDRNEVRRAWTTWRRRTSPVTIPTAPDAAPIDDLLAGFPSDPAVLDDVGCGDGARTLANLTAGSVGLDDVSRRGAPPRRDSGTRGLLTSALLVGLGSERGVAELPAAVPPPSAPAPASGPVGVDGDERTRSTTRSSTRARRSEGTRGTRGSACGGSFVRPRTRTTRRCRCRPVAPA